MSRLKPVEIYLLNLAGLISEEAMIYLDKEVSLRFLKEMTGEDFGYDVEKWRCWFAEHPDHPGF